MCVCVFLWFIFICGSIFVQVSSQVSIVSLTAYLIMSTLDAHIQFLSCDLNCKFCFKKSRNLHDIETSDLNYCDLHH